MATANTLEFANHEGDHAVHKLVLTVSQKGHPKLNQSHEIAIFTKIALDPGYAVQAVAGKLYVKTHTSPRSEGGKITLEGVTDSEKKAFMAFIGAGNGPAATICKAVITKKLPGLQLEQWAAEGLILHGIAMKDGGKEGTGTNVEGVFTRLLWPDETGEPTIDPIEQNF